MSYPLSPEWLTAIFTGIIAVTGVCALFYAHRTLSEAHGESQIQHLLSLTQEYDHEPMAGYRRGYGTRRLEKVKDPSEQYRMLDFFETVALLVNRGYLRDTDVWEIFSNEIFPLYADARDTIEQDQKDDPAEYSNLASLVQRLEVIEKHHGGNLYKPSKEDITDFWHESSTIGVGTHTVRRRRSKAKP
jgi:hypothetical protein